MALLFRFLSAAVLLLLFFSTAHATQKVTVQLRWHHQFQFAGYYAAISKGYYRDAGLDVTLVAGGVTIDTVEQVLTKNAQYGVTNSELLLHKIQGKPVIALAAIFQHSPHVFLTRKETGITHPHDFIGKTVKMSRESRDIELHATLRNEGVSLESLTINETQATPADYLDPDIDVIAAYITDQSYYFEQAGLSYTVIAPSAYGVDFYGDTLFTSEEEIIRHPDRVKAFLQASLQGWEYAMSHQEEIADILIEDYGCTMQKDHILREAKEMEKLILPDLVEIGHMNPDRWQNIGRIFVQSGLLRSGFSTDGFLYSSYKGLQESKVYRIGSFLLLAIAATAVLAVILLFFNKRLQREILKHRDTEKALLKSQSQLAGYAKQTEQFSLSAASIVSIKDERILFATISDAIVKYSDYERVLISLFHDTPPYRDLIGYAGVSEEIVNKVRKTELNRAWYDKVFLQGIHLGSNSYYIPHTMKQILNQEATIYGEGEIPENPDSWHPDDNLFVKMNGEDGEFIGVISVDTSKSGMQPTDEIVRPLEVYAALISQIIILKRNHRQREALEMQLRQAQKMEAIGNLTGGIAHDFNNILGVILGNVELALDCTEKNEECSIYLEEIARSGIKAKNIVQHLLTFSRKSEKKLSLIRLDSTLEESIGFLRSTTPSTITISKNIKLNDHSILADATQIYQIILNLCTNAVHAMDITGGTLSINAEVIVLDKPLIDVNTKELPPGKYVRIRIADTGHGIDKGILHQVFDPYFTTKEVGKGTGMGLSIVHGIVHNHDGAVTVTSQPGKGSVFSVYLPAYFTEVHDEQSAPIDLPSGTETILLVDDDPDLLEVSRRYLQRLGYRVSAYRDSVAALQAFSQKPEDFDIVITDMTMPVMTGETMAKEILAIQPSLPIFLCTGYSSLIDEHKAREIGICGYFSKPLNYVKFAHALRQILDKPEDSSDYFFAG